MNFLKNCPNCFTTLRFPASQGTVLVRCPVCSHRFQFNSGRDGDFTVEDKTSTGFFFKPSTSEYLNLLKDLLYAPIDFIQTKIGKGRESRYTKSEFWRRPLLLIEICLFSILLLYLARGLSFKDTDIQAKDPIKFQDSENPQPASEPENPKFPTDNIEPKLEI